jgi:hypothetical protein
MQNRQEYTNRQKKKKWFQNGIWSMTNYNVNDSGIVVLTITKIPILHKLVPMKHCHWNIEITLLNLA